MRANSLVAGYDKKQVVIVLPKVLLMDVPSLGLAPPLVSEALGRIQQVSRDNAVTVLIIEQKVREVLKIA